MAKRSPTLKPRQRDRGPRGRSSPPHVKLDDPSRRTSEPTGGHILIERPIPELGQDRIQSTLPDLPLGHGL